MSLPITDETLMAFADGELPPADEARVQAAVSVDPDLALRVAMFGETRRLARTAFADVVREPMPEVLVRAVLPTLASAPPAARSTRAMARAWRPALAASIALAAGLSGYAIGTRPTAAPSSFAALGRGEPALLAALAEEADGRQRSFDGGELRVGATFRLEGGRTCRTFEVSATGASPVSGLSCREPNGWRVDVATPGSLPVATAGDGGYRPASGDVGDLAALLDARRAEGPLPVEEVERLRAGGWTERR